MSGMHTVMAASVNTNASLPTPLDVFSLAVSPNTATASFTLNSNGTYSSFGTFFNPSGTWKIGGGIGLNYEARLTVVSGSFSGASTGVWLSVGSNRTWSVSRSSPGSTSASGTLEIRDATSGTVFTNSTLTITAEVDI